MARVAVRKIWAFGDFKESTKAKATPKRVCITVSESPGSTVFLLRIKGGHEIVIC